MKLPYLLLTVVLFLIACGAPAVISEQASVTPTDTSAAIYQATAEDVTYTVKTPLTVRSAPCESSPAIDYLLAGVAVETVDDPVVCSDGGRWTKLKDPDGWVNMRYIK